VKIGVAMATWNGAVYVEEQLVSMARQERRPDHVVVADDGSSDDTVVLVKQVCADHDLPLELLSAHDERLGATANFERAVRAVDADVIVLSDQDDMWRADKLATIELAFESGADAAFSDGRIVDATGRPTGKTLWQSFGYDRSAELLPTLLKHNVVTGATLAFSAEWRELLLPFGPDGWHDVWIAVLLAAAGSSLAALPAPLVDYRLHGSNAEGLGTRGARDAIAQRADQRKARELSHFEAMAARLRARRPGAIDAIALLDEKIEHLRHRSALPGNSIRRSLRIARLVPEYARFSSGWRSPLLDLVAPARAAS
jgi:glycosyltransferase involved in cell wall biosynthesis